MAAIRLTPASPFRRVAGFLAAASLVPALFATTPAARADDFTPAQRQEIIQIIRQALKTDPSILSDAIASLRAKADSDQAAGQQAAITSNHALLENTPGDQIAGNPHGSHTLYEFYDPRCPWCRRMQDDITRLAAQTPDLRIVLKLIAILGPQSTLAGRAILAAANQNAYLPLQHALMADDAPPSVARIRQIATGLHLDADRLIADMDSPTVTAELDAQRALAEKLQISGTPTFVSGTQIAPGAVSYDELVKLAQAGK